MVAQPLDLKALAKFVADEIYRKDSQNFPQEARGLSPGRNAGFRNFFNLGPNAAKPCT